MKRFDNMVEVLTYFANKSGMFKPILDGVVELQKENEMLKSELEQEKAYKDRVNLDNIYSTDTVVFKFDVMAMESRRKLEFDEDLFTLIKRVVEVGVDNYNYDKVLEMLDFYVTIGKLDWDAWDVIFEIMESQLEA